MGISRERLQRLSGEPLEELLKTDQLEHAFLQLPSLRNLGALTARRVPTRARPRGSGGAAGADGRRRVGRRTDAGGEIEGRPRDSSN